MNNFSTPLHLKAFNLMYPGDRLNFIKLLEIQQMSFSDLGC